MNNHTFASILEINDSRYGLLEGCIAVPEEYSAVLFILV